MSRTRKPLLPCTAFALFLCIFFSHAQAGAAERRYAALSLIGDALTVVTYQPQIGSRLNKNKLDRLEVAQGAVDRTALKALDAALRREDAQAPVVLLVGNAPGLFEQQERFFAQERFNAPAELAAPLAQSGATHLILLTKHRGETRVVLDGLSYGSGRLEGLGFYLDDGVTTRAEQTGEEGLGLIAPFLYFRASLIEVASGKVLASEIVTRTEGVSGALAKQGYGAWQALGEAEKVALLGKLLDGELDRLVPVLTRKLAN